MAVYEKEGMMNSGKFSVRRVLGGGQDLAKGKLLRKALNNRVLYQLALEDDLVEIRISGDTWVKKLKDTLLLVREVLGNTPYLVVRTYKYIPYVTFDVDLFLDGENFEMVIGKFVEVGCSESSHDSSLGGRLKGQQRNIKKEGLLTIDLHRNFTWQKRQFLDTELLFKNCRKRKVAGVYILISSP